VEWIRDGKPTMVGASSGAVAGLVAITPACGFIPPLASILLGIVAGAVCALAVGLKYRFGFDDSLDVVGVHFVGGWIGSLWIGLFATAGVNAVVTHKSVFFGGSVDQLWRQFVASASVSVYSFVIAGVIALILKAAGALRADEEAEVGGIDIADHGETAYDFTPSGGGGGAFAIAGLGSPVDADGKADVSQKVAG
jgi:Amt family ammonium transporter